MKLHPSDGESRGVSTILYKNIALKLNYQIAGSGENYITIVHAVSTAHFMLYVGANGRVEIRNALTSEFISKPQTIGQLIEELKKHAG